MSAARPAPSAGRKTTLLWALASTLPFVALMWWRRHGGPGYAAGDYAQYILHAQALLAGRAYDDIGYIWTEFAAGVGPKAYPPGLPLTLVPTIALFGANLAAYQGLMVLSGAAFLVLASLTLTPVVGAPLAALGAAFTGAVIADSDSILVPLSDPGFAALVWGALFLAREPVSITRPWRVAAFAACLAAAIAYRVAGVALIGAVFLYMLLNRERWLKWMTTTRLFIWGGMALVLAFALASRSTLFDITPRELPWLVALAISNAKKYALAFAAFVSAPFPFGASRVWTALMCLIALAGVPFLLRQLNRSLLSCVAVSYSLLLLVAPVSESRYLWPLYPLLAVALGVGMRQLLEWGRMPAPSAARVTLVGMSVAVLALAFQVGARPLAPRLVDHPDMQRLVAYLRALPTRDSERAVFFNPRVLTLETGVPAMPLPVVSPDSILAEARRQEVTLVVTGALAGGRVFEQGSQRLRDTLAARGSALMTTGTFEVYRIRPALTPTPQHTR